MTGDVAPDPNDVISARFRIDRELAASNARHPELAAELAAESKP